MQMGSQQPPIEISNHQQWLNSSLLEMPSHEYFNATRLPNAYKFLLCFNGSKQTSDQAITVNATRLTKTLNFFMCLMVLRTP